MNASWDQNKDRGKQPRSGNVNMLNQKLYEHLEEELDDIMEYHRFSEEALAAGYDELGTWLYEIAKDEYSHAKYIHEHLKKVRFPIPNESDIEARFYKIKQL